MLQVMNCSHLTREGSSRSSVLLWTRDIAEKAKVVKNDTVLKDYRNSGNCACKNELLLHFLSVSPLKQLFVIAII